MTGIKKHNDQNLVFENLWNKNPGEMSHEIIMLWKQFNPGMEEAKALERLRQIVFVVKNEFNQVIGITTAYKAYIKQLRNHLYAFRAMVVPGYRIPGLSTKLTVMTRDFLESIYQQEKSEVCIGMITLFENEELKASRREAILPDSGLVYIGNSSSGSHIRVYYFKHATIS